VFGGFGSAASGDTIAFGCSGDIPLSKTLTIAVNLTLDCSRQSVTLDGNNSVEVLSVNSGVTFTLNALTVAHGSTTSYGGGIFNNVGTVSSSGSIVANNTAQACSDLTGFINHVKAQSGKALRVSQANQLIAAAKQIQAVLDCQARGHSGRGASVHQVPATGQGDARRQVRPLAWPDNCGGGKVSRLHSCLGLAQVCGR
jgi:hypothetical protein